MNIFEQYLDKIKEILSTLSLNGDLILPDSLNGVTAEIPPSKFDSDISTNVAMVLSKINNKSPLDLASILAEKIKKEDKFIEDISIVKPGFINIKFKPIFWTNFIKEVIKNSKSFGTNKNIQKYVFFKDEIINVSFDELSYNTNNYYYSIDHYDFQWNKTNIFKNEFISGYDDIRISNFNKSLNTLQKYTNYTFSFPNEQFKIKVSGNYILSLKDSSDNIIFQRKFIVIENVNAGLFC